jgi:hypothetical protein
MKASFFVFALPPPLTQIARVPVFSCEKELKLFMAWFSCQNAAFVLVDKRYLLKIY